MQKVIVLLLNGLEALYLVVLDDILFRKCVVSLGQQVTTVGWLGEFDVDRGT